MRAAALDKLESVSPQDHVMASEDGPSGTLQRELLDLGLADAAMRWETRTEVMPEAFIDREGLARGPIGVLGTLREAAHDLAHVRQIKDISGQGGNACFAELARTLGFDGAQIRPIG